MDERRDEKDKILTQTYGTRLVWQDGKKIKYGDSRFSSNRLGNYGELVRCGIQSEVAKREKVWVWLV